MFCQEYLIDLNATKAAERAGYSKKTSNEQGNRLLVNVSVKDRIAELMEFRTQNLIVTQEDVIKELMVIAFSKITDYLEVKNTEIILKDETTISYKDVVVFNSEDYPDGKHGAIQEIKKTKEGISIKLYDKNTALMNLAKHLGMFIDKENLALRRQEIERKDW